MLFCVIRYYFKHLRCVKIITYNVCKRNLNFEDERMKKFLVPTAALTEQCNCGVVNNSQAEMLTYNVCKKNLNFEDARMKKFLSTLLNKISLYLTDLRNLMINATAALTEQCNCCVIRKICVKIITYNVCKRNLNFEDERMKKFLVPTVNINQGQSRIHPYPWDILEYVTQ